MNQMLKLFVGISVITLLLFTSSIPKEPTQASGFQDQTPSGEFRWTPRANGFAGGYKFGKQNFAVESYHPSPEFSLTRISRPGGIALMEVLRNGPTVDLTIADTRVSFNIGAEPSDFTAPEQAELQSALGSVDAMVARRVVAATIFQLKQHGMERRLLTGLGVASLVLGSEPKAAVLKADASRALIGIVPEECAADDCLGCCGSGCIGCIGCCTEACLAHDLCVRENGFLRCFRLLPAAIASIFLECL